LQYFFEDFVLDADRRELRRGSAVVPIAPLAFDLLAFLVRNRERVLTKDNLVASIWNGRIVSESAFSTCVSAARSAIGDTGEEQRLIRTLPRKGMRFVGVVREVQRPQEADATREQPKPVLSLPDRPSIAVLPFTNLSGDPEQEYFADGMVEDHHHGIVALALAVRDRTQFELHLQRPARRREASGSRARGALRDGRQRPEVGEPRANRGTAHRCIDWSAHLGRPLRRRHRRHFDLQDQVTASVVGAIAPKMEQAEIERARCKPTASLDSYDYYLQGLAKVHQATKPANGDALRLFHKAIELDPNFASAYGMAAWCYAWRHMNGWMADPVKETVEAASLARQAVELGKDDAVALTMGGWALARVVGEAEDGAAFIDQALILNPNLAVGWLLSGWINIRLGKPDVTIERATRAIRLSPLDPFTSLAHTIIGAGHFYAGRYDEASFVGGQGIPGAAKFGCCGAHGRRKPCPRWEARSSAQGHEAPTRDRSDAAGFRSQASGSVSSA
jgi:DNA-binding winged helix-turn-helix (wHTH) protein